MPEYDKFAHHPKFLQTIKSIRDWNDVKLLQRKILREHTPGQEPTAIHYDAIFLRDRDPSVLTTWIPQGDISAVGRGLLYLGDIQPVAKAMEEKWQSEAKYLSPDERISAYNSTMTDGPICGHDAKEFADRTGRKWLIASYEAGDLVFHDSFTIHASCENQDPENVIRLAKDLRYCNPNQRLDKRWMNN